mmetsp:Transcript_56279/g.138096  ORF Transcript_56279/g.138096 Transcript_56279/m.138096 type:complete len:531 (+) Transcript_56279:247-1839(+)
MARLAEGGQGPTGAELEAGHTSSHAEAAGGGSLDCGAQRPPTLDTALAPSFGGPSDQACDVGDAARGGHSDGEAVRAEEGLRLHVPSPSSKPLRSPLHKPWGSPSVSPKRAPTHHHHQNNMHRSNSFGCMSHLNLEEEIDGGEKEAGSPGRGTHHFGSPPTGAGSSGSLLDENGRPVHREVLEHTIGTVKQDASVVPKHEGDPQPHKGMRRTVSEVEIHKVSDDDDSVEEEEEERQKLIGEKLLVVLDMDHTMVGNLVAMSDRDNVEVNIDWAHWPAGRERGLTKDDIIPYLQRGMLRPGLSKFINFCVEIGATVVVYTHSEFRWASKVCAAMEEVIGTKFIHRLFSRQDCIDGHPEFLAKKSLEFIVDELKDQGLSWASVDHAIMFDDDKNALFAGEKERLIVVQSYDYWEPCKWDEIITEELLDKNPEDVVDLVRRTVVEWGIAPPSYGKQVLTEEDVKVDAHWTTQKSKKTNILMSYNKVSKLDRVWANIQNAMSHVKEFDEDTMESLPDKLRRALGGGPPPKRRMF